MGAHVLEKDRFVVGIVPNVVLDAGIIRRMIGVHVLLLDGGAILLDIVVIGERLMQDLQVSPFDHDALKGSGDGPWMGPKCVYGSHFIFLQYIDGVATTASPPSPVLGYCYRPSVNRGVSRRRETP
jgi:hypothetical protein